MQVPQNKFQILESFYQIQILERQRDREKTMQGRNLKYDSNLVLPRRSNRNVGKIEGFTPKRFICNYYSVNLNPTLNKIYMYEAKLPATIPADSSQVFAKCILQLRSQLKKTIQYICFSGKMVYGFRKITISETFQCQLGQLGPIQIQLKFNKEISIKTLLEDPVTKPMSLQFLNSNLKSCMRENNICEMGKIGAFYPKNQLGRLTGNVMNTNRSESENYAYLENIGLSVLRGYKFTLTTLKRDICLQLDVCSRVLQSQNLLQQLLNFQGDNQELLHHFIGKTIMTRYGNYKTYSIQDIDFTKNPCSTFDYQGEQKTFQFYFRKAYSIQISERNQPLIKVKAPLKKTISKKQKIMIEESYIFLIPELVSLTGMTDRQRANHQSMKALTPFTKLKPHDRFEQSSRIISLFNDSSEIIKIGGEIAVEGFQINPPTIGQYQEAQVRDGSIACRGVLLEPHQFKRWVFVYSVGNDKQDFDQACTIEDNLRQASKAYGIRYKEPLYIQVHGRKAKDFTETIINNISQYNPSEIQIVFVILKFKETTFYGQIKNCLVNELGVPSQIIQAKSLTRSKNVMSIASKIAIQMNCKAGSAPWVVCNDVPYLLKKNFSYCSLSSSKGKGGFTISFVGTINNQCTQVFSEYALRMKRKDIIDRTILKNWYVQWIKTYFMTNKKVLPELLIVYRESVGQSLFKQVVNNEITAMKQAIEKVSEKTKSSFSPQILYIFVNKKINSRFYESKRGQYMNPEPGSFIAENLSVDDQFDFHLAAQKVNQGTCTPTHYVIGYDETSMPQRDIIQFTYYQCYNYYNWQGTVKVPSMLQCTDKLSKLAGESIQRDFKKVKGSRVSKSFYFL